MTDLNKFGKEIDGFRNNTLNYSYSYNSEGNLFFKQDSEVFEEQFLKLQTKNSEYDYQKFFKLYNPDFVEFQTTVFEIW
jgi:hypothetical protein